MTATKPKAEAEAPAAETYDKAIPVHIPPGTVNWWASDHDYRVGVIHQLAGDKGYTVLSVVFLGDEPSDVAPEHITMLNYRVTYTGGPDEDATTE